MTLEYKLAQILIDMVSPRQELNILSWKDIIPLIDLTLLEINATPKQIYERAVKANHHHVASICVLPNQLGYVPAEIDITRATVINFPTGEQQQQQVLNLIKQTANLKLVNEIDYVFPYQTYLAGNTKRALSYCQEAFQLCKQYDLTFKVIIETGVMPSIDIIYDLSIAILHNGCDFLKTSTGKIAEGASIPAVFAMLSAIVDYNVPCGIKVSGGVKTIEQALSYMQLAQYMRQRRLDSTWFRLGTSGLLDVVVTANPNTHCY